MLNKYYILGSVIGDSLKELAIPIYAPLLLKGLDAYHPPRQVLLRPTGQTTMLLSNPSS